MPNWCDNRVVITATDKSVIDKIAEIAPGEESQFSMENFHPVPQELGEKTARPGFTDTLVKAMEGDTTAQYDNWYDWSIANWGTKWDIEARVSRLDDNNLLVSYDSAWSPNIRFWEAFTKFYPVRINHRYYEEGMSFIGEATIENGEADDYCVDISKEILLAAGAVLGEDGYVDWEVEQDYCLGDAFPLRSI